MEKKAEVALIYLQMVEERISVSVRSLAARAKVSKTFAAKIVNEMASGKGIQTPSDPKQRNIARGAGSKTLDEFYLAC